MSRIRKVLISFVLVVIIILLSLPIFLKNYIIDNSTELVGRKINLSKLSYNYITSTLKIYDLEILENNNEDVFTTANILSVNLNPLQLLNNRVDIEHIYIKGLTTTIVMHDSIFNFDDLLVSQSEEEDVSNQEESIPFTYSISNIQVKNSTVVFNNKNVGKETVVENIFLEIPNIETGQKEKSDAQLRFHLNNAGNLTSTFKIHPFQGDFNAIATIEKLQLNSFYEYVAPYALIDDLQGSLNGNLKLTGNLFDLTKVIVTGLANVDNFEMKDSDGKVFMSAKHMDTELQSIDYWNNNYQLATISLEEPYTYFQLDSLSNNFSRIFKFDHTEEEILIDSVKVATDTIALLAESPLKYTVNKLTLHNGVIDYTDNLTGQHFNYNLSNIQVNTDSITNASNWLSVYATMLLNKRGLLKSKLGIDPNNYLNSTLDLSVENFLLSDLNIYMKHYVGHSILKGDMYYTSKSKLVDGEIDSKNHLLVKHASLENTKGGLHNLPLKFAFFLLKDKHGDINFDIPVRGNLNDPNIDISAIVWKTFKNVIHKTIAKPVNFLVSAVGGNSKDLKELNFEYTDTLLSETHKKQLTKLLNLERKKNELKITMTYYVDTPLLTQSLAEEQIGIQFNNETGGNYLKDKENFNTYVYNKVNNDSLSIDNAMKQLTKNIKLDNLVSTRKNVLLQKVKKYLKKGYPATNVVIKQGKPEAPENTGAYPKFLITYGIINEQ